MVDLREHERKTLLALEKLGGKASVEQLIAETELSNAAIMRAALTMQEKKLVKINEKKQTIVRLNKEGKSYAEERLPERRIVEMLPSKGGETLISNISKEIDIPLGAIPVAIGWLVQKNWATINEKKGTIALTKNWLTQSPPKSTDEKLLELLVEKGAVNVEDLDKNLQKAVIILKRRKLIETKEKFVYELELTEKGRKLVKKGLGITKEEVTQLTPELIITGKWRETKLRK
ncbi:MAG: hypothetical protein K6T73_08685, partial [Candidatus Bathyarchaeota archaeon]|nr:hypothetical protein [Candidatus Bathyarchaeota archaeon]